MKTALIRRFSVTSNSASDYFQAIHFPSEKNVYSERNNPFNASFDENEAVYGRKCSFFQTEAVL